MAEKGHTVLLHGRNAAKIEAAKNSHPALNGANAYQADLSNFSSVLNLAKAISIDHEPLDVLINNAGVFKVSNPITADGLDVRFVVNTLAPYLLTKELLPKMNHNGRVINLSSAAQAPINLNALMGTLELAAGEAYAQSKLALTIWSKEMAKHRQDGPILISVNPGSVLGTKMVKTAYGMAGKDMAIGAGILTRLSLDPEYADANGAYYDNDNGQFSQPHPDAMNIEKSEALMQTLDRLLAPYLEME
jgi:NAD(P)-dependent dehydrogenase (short-subunit alcohol dehydrogenase family)